MFGMRHVYLAVVAAIASRARGMAHRRQRPALQGQGCTTVGVGVAVTVAAIRRRVHDGDRPLEWEYTLHDRAFTWRVLVLTSGAIITAFLELESLPRTRGWIRVEGESCHEIAHTDKTNAITMRFPA